MGNRSSVVDAEGFGQLQLVRTRRRHDAIYHRVWERTFCIDPIRKVGIAKPRQGHHRLTQDRTVALQVVTALPREGACASGTASFQCGDHSPKRRARGVWMRGIMLDVGMRRVKAFGHRVDIVSTFGHSQCDNPNRRIGHLRNQRTVVFFDRDKSDHGTDDFSRAAFWIQLDQCGQVILRRKSFALCFIRGADPCPDDRPIQGFALLHKTV